MLLRDVARERESRGIPAEWKHVVKRPAALHGSLPASRTAEVAQRHGKHITSMAPQPAHSKDVIPMAPQTTAMQSDGARFLAGVQPQQLPESMRNEDVEIEESLMRLITVRSSQYTVALQHEVACHVCHVCFAPIESTTGQTYCNRDAPDPQPT